MSSSGHVHDQHEPSKTIQSQSGTVTSKPKADGEVDDFGLPRRPVSQVNGHAYTQHDSVTDSDDESESDTFHDAADSASAAATPARNGRGVSQSPGKKRKSQSPVSSTAAETSSTTPAPNNEKQVNDSRASQNEAAKSATTKDNEREQKTVVDQASKDGGKSTEKQEATSGVAAATTTATTVQSTESNQNRSETPPPPYDSSSDKLPQSPKSPTTTMPNMDSPIMKRVNRNSQPVISEWSHQKLGNRREDSDEEEEVEWQAMAALDEFDVYDDYGKLVAKGAREQTEEDNPYAKIGGAGKGYTRVLLDDDVASQNSFEDDTDYLFKGKRTNQLDDEDLEEDPRDMLQQLQATKDLLTEGQRIAYVGLVRLTIFKMLRALEELERTRATKKETVKALENMEIWGQKMMVRLYAHMDIDVAEQLMIEQLAEHGVQSADLAPALMQNAVVKNPMVDEKAPSPNPPSSNRSSIHVTPESAPLKDVADGEEVPQVHGVEDAPKDKQIDLDIRWTVLCDLFLMLVADSTYDSRSRRLLERVASIMDITWIQICRFEKRVVDQLEMEEAAKENWDESEHMEERRKKALTRKYVMMGLATVGGGLVIGLSAGLLAPVIGTGLAAGFTTIGVTGTAGFLGGIGGAALITSAATAAGGTIAVRAAHRRTGHVRTFEYRPLHNNKRLNLILTISGWMTGKVDDVRLPFSTVDPIMGDIYSLYWEPEMLRSMGDTINILANEALTQSIQQVLGSTILIALMSAIQLPVILTKLSYLIDNPWSVSLDRATAAGAILADSLMAHHLGQRPVTLVGFSLGARVIFSCLKELSHRGGYGIVQNVYLAGSPVVAKRDEYLRARSVIAGRFVNAYASNDWILGYLFRATAGGIMRVAGLASVENVPGLENVDVTELVNGHMAYRQAMPKILRKLNWEIESDEFTEIEDPDPENHEQRQRELINEIEEARRKAEQKPAGRRFGFFKRGNVEKKTWETYEKQNTPAKTTDKKTEEENMWGEGKVLFDIDAIRKELASEHVEVRELDSTQPPIQISTVKNGQTVTEYLRLPPGISMDEAKKMKLPPRPHELDDGPPVREMPHRTASTPAAKTLAPSPLPSKNKEYDEGDFMPKEIKSTLPPLQLTPKVSQDEIRPELKSRTSTPLPHKNEWEDRTKVAGAAAAGAGLGAGAGVGVAELASPDLEHNAWGEDDGEITMTFA